LIITDGEVTLFIQAEHMNNVVTYVRLLVSLSLIDYTCQFPHVL